jgi:hypothetical protein
MLNANKSSKLRTFQHQKCAHFANGPKKQPVQVAKALLLCIEVTFAAIRQPEEGALNAE